MTDKKTIKTKSDHQSPDRVERLTKIFLIALYLAFTTIIVLIAPRLPGGWNRFRFSILDLVLLVFSVFRLGRLVAYDRVMEPIRSPFTQTVLDQSGAGENVEPRGRGVRQALGQLISCPICASTWIVLFLGAFMVVLPGPAHFFLIITAIIGLVELLDALVEILSWSGSFFRLQAGRMNLTPPSSSEVNQEHQQSLMFGQFFESNPPPEKFRSQPDADQFSWVPRKPTNPKH